MMKQNLKSLEVTNPFDHSHVGEVPLSDWDAVDNMLDHATKAFGNLDYRLSTITRMEILDNAAIIMIVSPSKNVPARRIG